MPSVASRDLRNHTADVLRQVADGTSVTVTVNGRSVAVLAPVHRIRPTLLTKADLIELLGSAQADAGLTADLDRLAGETTDDLDPL